MDRADDVAVDLEIASPVGDKGYRVSVPWQGRYPRLKIVRDCETVGLDRVLVDNGDFDLLALLGAKYRPRFCRSPCGDAVVVSRLTLNYGKRIGVGSARGAVYRGGGMRPGWRVEQDNVEKSTSEEEGPRYNKQARPLQFLYSARTAPG